MGCDFVAYATRDQTAEASMHLHGHLLVVRELGVRAIHGKFGISRFGRAAFSAHGGPGMRTGILRLSWGWAVQGREGVEMSLGVTLKPSAYTHAELPQGSWHDASCMVCTC